MIAALLLAAAAATAEPPPSLRCLARWYAVTPTTEGGRWFATLPDGTHIPYNDGRVKTIDERLADPDVKDTFSERYRRGPIVPATDVDDDPGRIRLDRLFAATYGASAKEVDLRTIDFLGQHIRVHRRVVDAFRRVAERLSTAIRHEPKLRQFFTHIGGTYIWRVIAGGTRQSAHSWGIAIDLNVKLSNYWRWSTPPRWRNRMPQAIVDAFEVEGFIWGGRWYHYDTMHFEYRPEMVDTGCLEPASTL